MSVDDIAQIFSIASSIGVIISLLLVAIQIRDSNRTNKASTYQNLIYSWNEYLLAILESPNLLKIRQTGMYNLNKLSVNEKEMFSRMCEYELGFHENMLYQLRNGTIDKQIHEGWVTGFEDWINRPGPKSYWKKREDVFSRDLRKFANKYLKTEPEKKKKRRSNRT